MTPQERDELRKGLYHALCITIAGTGVTPGIGSIPGLAYGAYVLGRPVAKWIGKGVGSAVDGGVELAKRRRELKRERERIANLPPPPPPPRPRTLMDDYHDLVARMNVELTVVDQMGGPDDEREIIREMIRAKYRDRIQELFA